MNAPFAIAGREIGPGRPTYIVAELSANHRQNVAQAEDLIFAAAKAGADAVKLQTYTADTLTLESDRPEFRIGEGTLWAGRTLHDLYREAFTPWEWTIPLKQVAEALGLALFSTPFDATAVEFLSRAGMPAYKIASFELVDLPLIERVAQLGRPMIMSTGMASLDEIREAVEVVQRAGAPFALLHCVSAYPTPASEMNLRTIVHLGETFQCPVGLSDHSLGIAAAIASVALGATIIEKHLTLDRDDGGPDAAFSLEPDEFAAMVSSVRIAEQALGEVHHGGGKAEEASRAFRRSLFIVADVEAGETVTEAHVRSIRPAHGLPPKYLSQVIGRRAARRLERGEPLSWEMLSPPDAR